MTLRKQDKIELNLIRLGFAIEQLRLLKILTLIVAVIVKV